MVVTRKKLLYYMLVELQSLVNVLFQNLESTEEDPSKVQECKVESLISKLGASSHILRVSMTQNIAEQQAE